MSSTRKHRTHVIFVSGLAGLPNAFHNIWSDEKFLTELRTRLGINHSDLHERGDSCEEENKESKVLFHFTNPGLLNSYHDQACELFAEIRGEIVDFGEEHSRQCLHSRYGRDFSTQKALVENWNANQPVHFVCHSTAANVVRKLHAHLSNDYWNCGTNGDWIRSILFLSPNFNGTPLTNLFGIPSHQEDHSKEKYVELLEKLIFSFHWFEKRMQNHRADLCDQLWHWHLQHWSLSEYHGNKWLDEVKESQFLTNNDHIFYDVTMHGCQHFNKSTLHTSFSPSRTYFLSLYSQITNKHKAILIRPSINPILIMSAGHMLCLKNTDLGLVNENSHNFSVEWLENDGLLPVAAQRYPLSSFLSQERQKEEVQLTFPNSPLPESWLSWCHSIVNFSLWNERESTPAPNQECLSPNVFYYSNMKTLLNSKRSWDHLDCLWGRDFLKPQIFQHSVEAHIQLYTAVLSFIQCFSQSPSVLVPVPVPVPGSSLSLQKSHF